MKFSTGFIPPSSAFTAVLYSNSSSENLHQVQLKIILDGLKCAHEGKANTVHSKIEENYSKKASLYFQTVTGLIRLNREKLVRQDAVVGYFED